MSRSSLGDPGEPPRGWLRPLSLAIAEVLLEPVVGALAAANAVAISGDVLIAGDPANAGAGAGTGAGVSSDAPVAPPVIVTTAP